MDYSGKKYFAELSTGKTVYYWTLVMGQIAAAISTTTKLQSVFGFGSKPYGFPNVTLNVMFILEVALGLAAIFFPVMNGWFDTYPLSAQSVLIPAVALVGICLIEEIRKFVFRQYEDDDDEGGSGSETGETDSESDNASFLPR